MGRIEPLSEPLVSRNASRYIPSLEVWSEQAIRARVTS